MKAVACLCLILAAAPVLAGGNESRPQLIAGPSESNPRTIVALTHASRCSFLLPRGWNLATDEESRTLRISQPQIEAVISLRFCETGQGKSTDEFTKALLKERGGGHVRDIFSLPVAGTEVDVIDLSWLQANSMSVQGRFLRVPAGSELIEISLVSPAAHFPTSLPSVMQLLGSLQRAASDQVLPVKIPTGTE